MPADYLAKPTFKSSYQPGGYSADSGIESRFSPSHSGNLTGSLDKRFSDTLPTYNDFKDQYKEAYAHNYIRGSLDLRRKELGRDDGYALDGVVKGLSEKAGYSDPKQITRLRNTSGYVKKLIDSVSLGSDVKFDDVERNSGFVNGLLDYKGIVNDYSASSQKHIWLDRIAGNLQDNGFATDIKQKDISQQVLAAPAEAQLYKHVDYALLSGKGLVDSFNDARQGYLALVAGRAQYDEKKMKNIMGKQYSTTTIGRMFERAGLDFKQMKENFHIYQELKQHFEEEQKQEREIAEPVKFQEKQKKAEEQKKIEDQILFKLAEQKQKDAAKVVKVNFRPADKKKEILKAA